MTNNIHVLDQVDLIELQIDTWGGEKALSKTEKAVFNAPGTPDDRHYKGAGKTLVFSERLREFATLRAKIETLLRSNGTRFGKLYAIASARMPEVIAGLESYKALYRAAVEEFLDHLPDYYAEVIQDLTLCGKIEWAEAVRASHLTRDEVRTHFGFFYLVFKYGASPHAPVDNTARTFDVLFTAVCRDLYSLLDKHIAKVNARPSNGTFRADVRGTYAEAAQKARCFDFLPHGAGLVAFAERCERIASGSGTVEGPEYSALAALFAGINGESDMAPRIADLATSSSSYGAKFDAALADLFSGPAPRPRPTVPTVDPFAGDEAPAETQTATADETSLTLQDLLQDAIDPPTPVEEGSASVTIQDLLLERPEDDAPTPQRRRRDRQIVPV